MISGIVKKHKNDLIALIVICALGGIMCTVFMVFGSTGDEVRVKVAGEVVETIPLNSDGTYEIAGADGGSNLLVIEDGKAYISEASCPDGLCKGMGAINMEGQSIVCLPNKVVVEIVSDGKEAAGGNNETKDTDKIDTMVK